jgi:hypothetical protein
MSPFIPVWIIGGPFVALVGLSFAFKGPSAMGGTLPRDEPYAGNGGLDRSAPLLDPIAPSAPRRLV